MSTPRQDRDRYVALSGGVGGAKLSLGLAQLLGERLTVIVNTGDDFEHLGLHISPDVDTALYTLAGVVNPETGWGRRDETWTFMAALQQLGGPGWFKLGDADLATHIERTRRLRSGETLTSITTHLAQSFGVKSHILPMCDEALRTVRRDRPGPAGVPGLFRARAVPANRPRHPLRRCTGLPSHRRKFAPRSLTPSLPASSSAHPTHG